MSIAGRIIGVRELKARTSEVLREVQETGAEFVITVRGKAVARLEPLTVEERALPVDGMGGLRGALKDWPKLEWEDFLAAKKAWEPGTIDDDR